MRGTVGAPREKCMGDDDVDRASQPQRDKTDESLRVERDKTDVEVAEKREAVDELADEVVRLARQRTPQPGIARAGPPSAPGHQPAG